jgi:hypothetical protein
MMLPLLMEVLAADARGLYLIDPARVSSGLEASCVVAHRD